MIGRGFLVFVGVQASSNVGYLDTECLLLSLGPHLAYHPIPIEVSYSIVKFVSRINPTSWLLMSGARGLRLLSELGPYFNQLGSGVPCLNTFFGTCSFTEPL